MRPRECVRVCVCRFAQSTGDSFNGRARLCVVDATLSFNAWGQLPWHMAPLRSFKDPVASRIQHVLHWAPAFQT